MKKFMVISVVSAIAAGYTFLSCKQATYAPEKEITRMLLAQVDSFSVSCKMLEAAAHDKTGPAAQQKLQQLFLRARLAYKNIEWATEYFEPVTSRFVNGPPVQEVETSGQVFEPEGMQVIEAYLFPTYDTARRNDLIRQLGMLQARCDKYKTHFAYIDIFDWQVFDAAKLEVFRVETLGITGFDNPLSLASMAESAASLAGVQKIIALYKEGDIAGLLKNFKEAIHYLTANVDFNSFDRAAFITAYGNPLTKGISCLEEKLKIHITRYNRLLNQDAKTLFDTGAFNVNAYAPDQSSFTSDEKITLGKALFSDAILSGNGKRSCRTCHQPEKAFADGLVKNTIIGGNGTLKRNTPTLLNAAFQPAQFYDLRVNSLEDQSIDVVQSSLEMHGAIKLSVEKLWEDRTYRKLFSTAFPKNNRNCIDTIEVMNAIASYVRSLARLNSRFDEYMRGDKRAMRMEEITGFNLFMGKAKCATCHYMPLFNGTFPPRFVRTEAEVIGVPSALGKNEIDSDMGRFGNLKAELYRHAFKTPSVRNAASTAPYMHNGVFATLSQVLDFYDKGGGRGSGMKINNQTLPVEQLRITEEERKDIIAFINTLTNQ